MNTPLASGHVISGRFVIETLAGRGGMGVVYRAIDKEQGRSVALKVLLDADEDGVDRFLREARVLARFEHPGITRHIAHGLLDDGCPYLVMEWLDGEDLATRLLRGPLDVEQTMVILNNVAKALGTVHAVGIVHRDIKPQNLFLPGGRIDDIKLLDFGIARLSNATRMLTQTGTMLGTAAYMAPEQIRGEKDIDGRADLYALGCVVFECLAGRPPFVAAQFVATLTKALFEEPPRLRECNAATPAKLDELVARLLEKDRDRRPGSTVELLEALSNPSPRRSSGTYPATIALATRERRLVCIVLVAPTSDPAVAATIMADATLDAPADDMLGYAQRFSVRLEPLGQGHFAALLTGDTATHDLAARAARFALELRRSGNSSTIVIALGRDESGDAQAMGVVIDRAANLFRPTGQTIVDSTCARLLEQRFLVEEDSGRWVLQGETLSDQSTDRSATPFIGRERELSRLVDLFDASQEERYAVVSVVTAEAGTGKTRLRDEFLRSVRGLEIEVEIGQALGNPMSAGSPFVMISAALRDLCGIRADESAAEARKSIRAYVERWLKGSNALRVMRFVGELLNAPFEDADGALMAARADPILMGNQIRMACEDLFASICASRPLLLVLDDMQWGDVATVKLLDGALRHLKDAPFCIFAFARPDIDEVMPDLWIDRNAQRIKLMPLVRKACERLVQKVLGANVSDTRVAQIVERCGGNAFFLEELLRAERDGADGTFPETVLAMAQLRIERLEPEMRRALRVASIFGTAFDENSMGELLDEEPPRVATLFERLIGEEILVRIRTQTAEESHYAFRHAFFREAAYEMLTADDRVLGHLRVAEHSEKSLQADALTTAQHFERGGAPARALQWWTRAVEEAVAGNDLEGAIPRGLHALALDAPPESKGRLRLLLATACCWLGRFEEADEHATVAMDALLAGSPDWYSAAERLNWSYGARGLQDQLDLLRERLARLEPIAAPSNERAIAWAALAQCNYLGSNIERGNELLALAEQIAHHCIDRPAVDARIASTIAMREAISQRMGHSATAFARASELYERIGAFRNAVVERANLGAMLISLGAHAEADSTLREAATQAKRLGLPGVLAWIHHCIGRVSVMLGATQEGFAMMATAATELKTIGNHRGWTIGKVEWAWLLIHHGHVDAATENVAEVFAIELSDNAAILAHAIRARVHLARANPTAALEDAQAAASLIEKTGDREHLVTMLVTLARALKAAGRLTDAMQTIQQAVEVIYKAAELLDDAEQRRTFIECVPENREALELASFAPSASVAASRH